MTAPWIGDLGTSISLQETRKTGKARREEGGREKGMRMRIKGEEKGSASKDAHTNPLLLLAIARSHRCSLALESPKIATLEKERNFFGRSFIGKGKVRMESGFLHINPCKD